ncbi:MAG: 16S rRNA (adenine(1518)-N(6)/adenine(1519)-N(6))-dimethyltransferase RsmA [Buchnera aphidicola (Meitanaphis elongallis)]
MIKYIAKKRLGQNFLIDSDVINNIISSINPKKTDIMIEIGSGLGALTHYIYKFLNKLFLIEYDSDLVARLRLSYQNIDKITIFSKNVLEFNFVHIEQKFYDSIRIFGNLPYNISVAILLYLFKYNNIVDMHFMFQKEVANRLLASPGTKNYGRLSIISQYFCKMIRLFDINPTSFKPIPKVSSTFLRLVPYKSRKYYVKNIKNLSKVTSLAFGQRRKIVRHSLSSLFSENVLIALGIDPMLRAENISIMQYCKLSNFIGSQDD